MPGRGAYVCREEAGLGPKRACLILATKPGTLQRAFRRAVEIPVELLELDTRVAQPDISPAGRNGDTSRKRVSTGFGRAPRHLNR